MPRCPNNDCNFKAISVERYFRSVGQLFSISRVRSAEQVLHVVRHTEARPCRESQSQRGRERDRERERERETE
eukprot:COSAG03_NODE_19924_length_327_cov_1.324561_1_plen_72_part_10